MIRINLLPHREERRRATRQQFYALSGLVVLAALLIIFFVHGINSARINTQEQKNAFLRREITVLDQEIGDIRRMKEESSALLARKKVIEALQSNRAEAVTLFNDLARLTPEGIYFKSLKQTGNTILLVGYAQSNARVSSLMHNLETSHILEMPSLVEIQAVTVDKRRLSQFTLNVRVANLVNKTLDKGGRP